MGTFFVTIGVGDPSGSRFEPVEMLVDTGSTYTMLPASVLRSIGVAPVETLRFRLADGRRVEREVGDTFVQIDNRVRPCPVVFADEDAHALLGAVTLEIFGLAADPVNRRLVPVELLAMA